MRPERPLRPNDPASPEREQLATILAFMLLALFGGAFVLFLIFVSLGLFLWVILIAGVIAVYTGVHYLIWGRPKRTKDSDTIDVEPTAARSWPDDLLESRKPADREPK